MSAVIIHGDALDAVLHLGNAVQVNGLCIDQYIGAERIPGRNGEIVVAAAAGNDDLHIPFCNSCFFDNHFHDFREFISAVTGRMPRRRMERYRRSTW